LKVQNSYDSLSEVNKKLRKATETLKVTLEFIDEGVITIDPDGTILRGNHEASRILNITYEEMIGTNIKAFLSPKSTLMNLVSNAKAVDYMEDYIVAEQREKLYIVSIKPVTRQWSNELDFAILSFNHSDKINALVNSRSGAIAKYSFDDIIGQSEIMGKAKSLANRFAKSRENVLLLGESGTGKELFAQAIHNHCRAGGPFIAVNCAAMPRNLVESELFGYESGAFTGAEKNGRPGKIELANGGTLFLDEIGDMPYELQAVILRVLQDKMVMRLGGKHYRQVNFRLITATNQNLRSLIREKKFREDLYFRLSVLNIDIPPLRNRGYDIAILAQHFIKHYAERIGLPVPTISSEAKEKILEYNWPGNVRQLENAVAYAVNLAEDGIINLHHLPVELLEKNEPAVMFGNPSAEETKLQAPPDTQVDEVFSLKDSEKIVIQKALARAGNSVAIASKLMGISKTTLYRKMKEHHIDY
jgi:transcriptional regulator with PAS, ATPase and Fis domain